jgi:hypothetical protein
LKDLGLLIEDQPNKLFSYNQSRGERESLEFYLAADFGSPCRKATRLLVDALYHDLKDDGRFVPSEAERLENVKARPLDVEERGFRNRVLLEVLFGESHPVAVDQFIKQVQTRSGK